MGDPDRRAGHQPVSAVDQVNRHWSHRVAVGYPPHRDRVNGLPQHIHPFTSPTPTTQVDHRHERRFAIGAVGAIMTVPVEPASSVATNRFKQSAIQGRFIETAIQQTQVQGNVAETAGAASVSIKLIRPAQRHAPGATSLRRDSGWRHQRIAERAAHCPVTRKSAPCHPTRPARPFCQLSRPGTDGWHRRLPGQSLGPPRQVAGLRRMADHGANRAAGRLRWHVLPSLLAIQEGPRRSGAPDRADITVTGHARSGPTRRPGPANTKEAGRRPGIGSPPRL
jgi:hypothetical protein